MRRASKGIQGAQTRGTLHLAIVRCRLRYATQVWSPQSVGLLKQVECVQRRATKYILKFPFRCDVKYNTRLQLTNLLRLCYWHEYLDIVFFYKAVNDLIYVNSESLPVVKQPARPARSSSNNSVSFDINSISLMHMYTIVLVQYIVVLRAPIDNRQLFASEGATLSSINQ